MVSRFKAFEDFENGDGYHEPIIAMNSETGSLYAVLDFQSIKIGTVRDSLETLSDAAHEAYLVLMGYTYD